MINMIQGVTSFPLSCLYGWSYMTIEIFDSRISLEYFVFSVDVH